jgi:O-antigen/teichoic acid export membrane protein
LSSEATVGRYSSCQTLVGLGNMILVGVSNYLHPKSAEAQARGGPRQLRRVLLRNAALLLTMLGTLCLLVAVTEDLIPTVVFGPQFEGLGATLLYLTLALTAGALGMVAGNGIWAINCPAWNLVADATALGVTVVTGYLWIPSQLALGAARSVWVGALSAALVRWLVFFVLLGPQPATAETGVGGAGGAR